MSDVIDFKARKAAKEDRPDADCVMRDDLGREMFLFLLDYEHDGSHWGLQFWAYDVEDAMAKTQSMRQTLKCVGMKMGEIPA